VKNDVMRERTVATLQVDNFSGLDPISMLLSFNDIASPPNIVRSGNFTGFAPIFMVSYGQER
jgi:hypothetical protein